MFFFRSICYGWTVVYLQEESIVILFFTCWNILYNCLFMYLSVLCVLAFICAIFPLCNVFIEGLSSHKSRFDSQFLLTMFCTKSELCQLFSNRPFICMFLQFRVSVFPLFSSWSWCFYLGNFYLVWLIDIQLFKRCILLLPKCSHLIFCQIDISAIFNIYKYSLNS